MAREKAIKIAELEQKHKEKHITDTFANLIQQQLVEGYWLMESQETREFIGQFFVDGVIEDQAVLDEL